MHPALEVRRVLRNGGTQRGPPAPLQGVWEPRRPCVGGWPGLWLRSPFSFLLSNKTLEKEIAACHHCGQAGTRGGSWGHAWAPWQHWGDPAGRRDASWTGKPAPRWTRPLMVTLCVRRGECGQEGKGVSCEVSSHLYKQSSAEKGAPLPTISICTPALLPPSSMSTPWVFPSPEVAGEQLGAPLLFSERKQYSGGVGGCWRPFFSGCVWWEGCGMKVTVDTNVLCLVCGVGSLREVSPPSGS